MDFIYQLGGITKTDQQLRISMHNKTSETSFDTPGMAVTSRVELEEPIFADDFLFLSHTVSSALPKLTIPSPSMVHYRAGASAVDRTSTPTSTSSGPTCPPPTPTRCAPSTTSGAATCSSTTPRSPTSTTPTQRAVMAARGEDADHQHLRYIKQINAALADRPSDMAVTTHMCRGNYRSSWAAEGGYDYVAEALFGELDVDGFFCEFDDERSGAFAPLRFVPPGKQVVLGLVTTKSGALEDADTLKRRIDEAAEYLPLDQLCLSPQCGFSSTVEGNALTVEEQWAKLRLIVEVAADVWK